MERTVIIEKLTTVFCQVFDDENLVLTEEMTSDDVEKWDSLTHMQLITGVEKEFGIKFKLREILGWNNVGEMIRSIEGKLG